MVLTVIPKGRILVRWQSSRNKLKILCHSICNCLYQMHNVSSSIYIELRKCVGCLKLQVSFRKRATNYSDTRGTSRTMYHPRAVIHTARVYRTHTLSLSLSFSLSYCYAVTIVCIYIYMYIYIYIHTYAYMNILMYMCIHLAMHTALCSKTRHIFTLIIIVNWIASYSHIFTFTYIYIDIYLHWHIFTSIIIVKRIASYSHISTLTHIYIDIYLYWHIFTLAYIFLNMWQVNSIPLLRCRYFTTLHYIVMYIHLDDIV